MQLLRYLISNVYQKEMFMKKKFIVIIIIFALVLAAVFFFITRDQKIQAQGENLKVVARGINTKKLSLKVSGTFPEGTTPHVSYIDEDVINSIKQNSEIEDFDFVPVISVSVKSSKDNYVEYIISGLNEGYDEFKISFVKDDISYAKITASITVDEKLKMSQVLLSINEVPDQYVLSGEVVTESIDDMELYFSLKDEAGEWKTLSYDENIIQVSGAYRDRENLTSNWSVSGLAVGTTNLVIANGSLGKKIDFEIECYMYDEEDGILCVKVLSSGEGNYDDSLSLADVESENIIIYSEEITDADGNVSTVTSSAVCVENLYVPEVFKIKDVYTYEDEDSYRVMCLKMLDGDSVIYVLAFGNASLDGVRKSYTEESFRNTLQKMTIAGTDLEYYDAGIDMFLFEKDGTVYLLTIAGDPDIEAHQAIMEKYLN